MTLVDDGAQTSELQTIVEQEERRRALEALRNLAPLVQAGEADRRQLHLVEGAMVITMAQKIAEAAPMLRLLEGIRSVGSSCSRSVLGARWYSHYNTIRSLARLALRHIGEHPCPGGNYTFSDGLSPAATVSTCAPSKARELAKETPLHSKPQWVLSHSGSPDFIHRHSKKMDKHYVWSEAWDYDGPTGTTRLTWSFPETSRREVAGQPREVTGVDESTGWQDGERLLATLAFVWTRL